MDKLFGLAALLLTAQSAYFAYRAQTVKIRNSMDDFIDDLQLQGSWSLWASISQSGAVAILVVRYLVTGSV